jgi:cold shock CspA family protein
MQIPLQITFRDIPPSEAVEARIRKEMDKLEQFNGRITSCRVVVEAPHRRHHKGRLYHLRIDLTLPGGELVVNREPSEKHSHEDVYVAVRDAFRAAQRELKRFGRKRRGEVKHHEAPAHGRVAKLFAQQGYGFIEAPAGRQVYFHQNAVPNEGFAKLEVGNEVRYVQVPGDEGPQASTVTPIGKHHILD